MADKTPDVYSWLIKRLAITCVWVRGYESKQRERIDVIDWS